VEMQILYAFARQLDGKEMAAEVHLGIKGVEAAKARMIKRLNLDNFLSVFIYACQHGIINIDEIPLRKKELAEKSFATKLQG
jgi:DNA-binding NarL/FixJ family response regulator